MSGGVRIVVPAKDLAEAVKVVGAQAHKGVARVMTLMAEEHVTRVKIEGFRGERLRRRTGMLRNSLGVSPAGSSAAEPTASSFSAGVKYAAIQDQGGIVRPKKGTYLTVPLPFAKTARGVTRASAALVKNGDKWQTKGLVPGAENKDTWIKRKRPTSRPVVFVMGKSGEPMPLYLLVRKVVIEGNFGFSDIWDDLEPRREKMWKRTLDLLGQHFKPRQEQ